MSFLCEAINPLIDFYVERIDLQSMDIEIQYDEIIQWMDQMVNLFPGVSTWYIIAGHKVT
jgi:hypothetical protein